MAYGAEKLGFENAADKIRTDIDKPGIKIPGIGVSIDPTKPLPFMIDPTSAMAAAEKLIGGENGMYRAKTTPGKYWSAAAEAVPGIAVGGGATAPNVARNALKTISGALGGEAAAQAAGENNEFAPLWRTLGSFAGAAAPSAARRMVTPFPTTPQRMGQAADVESRGVRLGAGQVTGSPSLNPIETGWRNSAGGGRGLSDVEQREAVSRALMRSTGAPDGLPYLNDVRAQAARLASQREALAARTHIPFDRALMTDVTTAADRARRSLALPVGAPVPGVTDTTSRLFRDPATGRIRMGTSGPEYLEMRSQLRNAGMAETSPATRQAYMDMRAALDRASERANPGFAGIHERMANARALEHTMDRNAPLAAQGHADPGIFHQQHSVPTAATPTFARNAQAVLEPPPSSAMTGSIPAALGGLASAYLAHKYGWTGGPMESLIGGAVIGTPGAYAALHNPVTAAAATNPLTQAYLRNQAFRPSGDPTSRTEMMARILAGSTPFREGIEPE
jgi:hypothetical protein